MRADRALPFSDNSYGIIESSHSLEHMEDTEKTMREWIRILKPGGILLIIVPDGKYHKHDMDVTKSIGERCFIEWSVNEFKEMLNRLTDVIDVIQFNTRNNNFDIDIIVRKK